ncbi:hypothetical protein Q5H91_11100 [Sphingomonas sp. KR1UV-12]|uniref:Uncharacterized protein n=1 Tax=Sphingomonas aurea TaxID=3063994 RepID=A0ABT9ELU7_9SPHN|nr:hypothetical protein [Sphingomonas sp. KR1UV-12]MDP1027763.1 hypothetical protein [Sphingomonas sp. KR1UV-12]
MIPASFDEAEEQQRTGHLIRHGWVQDEAAADASEQVPHEVDVQNIAGHERRSVRNACFRQPGAERNHVGVPRYQFLHHQGSDLPGSSDHQYRHASSKA